MVRDTPSGASRIVVFLLLAWVVGTAGLWWLALYPIADATPEWLARAKLICFGSREDGLPDMRGWILLVAYPLVMIAAVAVGMTQECLQTIRVLRQMKHFALLMSFVGILVTAQIVWAAGRIQNGLRLARANYSPSINSALPEHYPRTSHTSTDFTLVDQFGEEVSLRSLRGKAVILTFAFAHCATVCPALVSTTHTALASLDPLESALVIVTLDPWRDTPGSLPSLAEHWNLPSNARVLSGAVDEVMRVISAYEVPIVRDEKTGDVTHPALVFIIAPDGRLVYTFNNPPAVWITDAVTRILSSNE